MAVFASQLTGIDNWTLDQNTWTFSSATAFTISSATDFTGVFVKGTRLKLTQSSAIAYFVVTSSSFAASTTTVNITAGTSYTFANSAVSNTYYSYAVNPAGWPTWFNYTPTYAGYSANPTSDVTRFKVEGNTCTLTHREGANGTSSASTTTFTIPIAAATITNMRWIGATTVIDNGVTGTTPGALNISSAATVADNYKNSDLGATLWTASGSKRGCAAGSISYEF